MKTSHRNIIESMVRINDKTFTIISKLAGQFVQAVCPNGRRCFIDFKGMKILHRDSMGRIQGEPFITY